MFKTDIPSSLSFMRPAMMTGQCDKWSCCKKAIKAFNYNQLNLETNDSILLKACEKQYTMLLLIYN